MSDIYIIFEVNVELFLPQRLPHMERLWSKQAAAPREEGAGGFFPLKIGNNQPFFLPDRRHDRDDSRPSLGTLCQFPHRFPVPFKIQVKGKFSCRRPLGQLPMVRLQQSSLGNKSFVSREPPSTTRFNCLISPKHSSADLGKPNQN